MSNGSSGDSVTFVVEPAIDGSVEHAQHGQTKTFKPVTSDELINIDITGQHACAKVCCKSNFRQYNLYNIEQST